MDDVVFVTRQLKKKYINNIEDIRKKTCYYFNSSIEQFYKNDRCTIVSFEYSVLSYYLMKKTIENSSFVDSGKLLSELSIIFEIISRRSAITLFDKADNISYALSGFLNERIFEYRAISKKEFIPIGWFLTEDYDQNEEILRLLAAFGDYSIRWIENDSFSNIKEIENQQLLNVFELPLYQALFTDIGKTLAEYINAIYHTLN